MAILSVVEEKVVNQLSDILELWNVTYNVVDEKYIAKTKTFVILNSEQLEWIGQMGLSIFSIQKYDDTLTVRFVSGGGECFS